jgi:hypothetical protein
MLKLKQRRGAFLCYWTASLLLVHLSSPYNKTKQVKLLSFITTHSNNNIAIMCAYGNTICAICIPDKLKSKLVCNEHISGFNKTLPSQYAHLNQQGQRFLIFKIK